MKKKLKIGVTGGMGSGKTLLTDYFAKQGYPVLKSDEVAKQIMNSDETLRKKIIRKFGASAYDSDGLNRKYLAENVFNDDEKISAINALVHPPTTKKIDILTKELFSKHNLVFVESALIYEAKIQNMFDYIILVSAQREARIKRIQKKENLTKEEIEKRMRFQMSDEDKKERADFVIENNGSVEDLEKRGEFLLTLLKSMTH